MNSNMFTLVLEKEQGGFLLLGVDEGWEPAIWKDNPRVYTLLFEQNHDNWLFKRIPPYTTLEGENILTEHLLHAQ